MYELCEVELRLPPELPARLGRIADQPAQRRSAALERRIRSHIVLPVEPNMGERDLDELAHRVRFARGDDVVSRLVLLQHQPHCPYVVAGVAPVTCRV